MDKPGKWFSGIQVFQKERNSLMIAKYYTNQRWIEEYLKDKNKLMLIYDNEKSLGKCMQ